MTKPDMSTSLGPLQLQNPVITASGTCGFGDELKGYLDLEQLGAITVKGITVNPSSGNQTPRIVETSAGLLNSIGLENPGLDRFINNKLELISQFEVPVIVNISGHSLEDFAILSDRLASLPELAGLEVNVSCPNIAGGGMAFGTNSESVFKVTKTVKDNYGGPIIVKLSPNVTDIVEIAIAAEEAGADIISLINTLLAMSIDVETQKPELGNVMGGLSGPAIKPVALRMVYQVATAVDIPLIGMGGIVSGKDAVEFMLAGASAVGVGTATLIDPRACKRILNEIEQYLHRKHITEVKKIIGNAHVV